MAHALVKDLRDAVLQAAITGKLSKQNAGDTSVIETLHKCEDDKKHAIKDGKFRKEAFRSPVINDELPEIPSHWKWAYISDVTLFQEGPGILAVDFCNKGTPLIRIAGMQTDEVKLIGCNFLSPEKVEQKWKHYKLDKGDILISTSASMDKICEVYEEAEGAIPYTGQIRFKMYGNINKEYFKVFVKSPYYSKQISEQEAGGTIKHYGPTHLRKMYIAIPPIEEQARIVAKVDELMAKVDEYEKLEKELAELKEKFPREMHNAILQAAMEGKITDSSKYDKGLSLKSTYVAEPPYDIPEKWGWYNLKDLIWNRKQKKPDKLFCYIDIGSIDNKKCKLNDKENIIEPDKAPSRARKTVQKGDIIYSTVRPYLHNIAIIDKEFSHEPIVSTGFATMVCNSEVNNKFLFYFLQSPFFDSYVNDTDNSKGIAYPAINDKKLYSASVPLPPIEEQQRIVERLDKLLPMCDELANLC